MENYCDVIENPARVANNAALLRTVGVSEDEANRFAPRRFAALPLWIRTRLKRVASRPSQADKFKLRPQVGEKAFFIESSRFPSYKSLNKKQQRMAARTGGAM